MPSRILWARERTSDFVTENSRSRAHRDSTPLSSSGTAGGFHQKVQMSGVSCILGLPPRHNLPIIKTPELPRSSIITTVVPPLGRRHRGLPSKTQYLKFIAEKRNPRGGFIVPRDDSAPEFLYFPGPFEGVVPCFALNNLKAVPPWI